MHVDEGTGQGMYHRRLGQHGRSKEIKAHT